MTLEMPLEYGVASSSKAVFIPKRPYWGIIALPDDPMEDQDDLDMFQWPPMDRPPRGSSPSLPQNLLGLETDHGLRELHDFLDELEPSHFEPRMSSVEVPIDGLSIAYCGDQTTFTNTKKWSRLTIYHIGDASREATRSKALEAIGLGATDLEC
ncbi:hypothetical protein FRB90_000756 [Tulasnella sp. 427]|nr:hypothetical protein FRB90_000756 [Tulasnella sp. 427]